MWCFVVAAACTAAGVALLVLDRLRGTRSGEMRAPHEPVGDLFEPRGGHPASMPARFELLRRHG